MNADTFIICVCFWLPVSNWKPGVTPVVSGGKSEGHPLQERNVLQTKLLFGYFPITPTPTLLSPFPRDLQADNIQFPSP